METGGVGKKEVGAIPAEVVDSEADPARRGDAHGRNLPSRSSLISQPLLDTARAWGVEPGYEDVDHRWHDASEDTLRAVLACLGAEDGDPPPVLGQVRVVRQGDRPVVGDEWVVTLEGGGERTGRGPLPADLPLGYHALSLDGEEAGCPLIVSPGTCFHPGALRTWGWAVQLYAARSRKSWGIGDLGDLRDLATWSAVQGAGAILVNPLHAALPGVPQQPSPYFPSSRCFRNPLYLRVEEVPGAAEVADAIAGAATAGRALLSERRIDRDAIEPLKLAALEAAWRALPDPPGLAAYRAEMGRRLRQYATFCVLAEVHGRPWSGWPEEVRRPDSPAVEDFASRHADRVAFHEWLQWCLDLQLRDAGAAVPLMHDVAIGADAAGADAWLWQDAFALGARVGAPPDEFNVAGQEWGLPPLDPWKLRAAAYEPFIAAVRAGFRHAGALRFDHVMGLFRLFWIPEGADATGGAYVRYPWTDLLDILALESVRAQAYVVGEDLGTVEDAMRDALAERRVLSYRLLWFEDDVPAAYPEKALAAVTTHDLPTIAGLWTGSDLASQQAMGLQANAGSTLAIRDRLQEWTGVADDAPVSAIVDATHQLLADAASEVVLATLDDALGVEERPNHPGTTDEWPNWCIALPMPLEEIVEDTGVAGVTRTIGRARP